MLSLCKTHEEHIDIRVGLFIVSIDYLVLV